MEEFKLQSDKKSSELKRYEDGEKNKDDMDINEQGE